MWVAKGDICMATIPKVASSSIKAVFGPCKYLTNLEAMEYPNRIAFIRYPMARYKEGYFFYKHLKNIGSQYISEHGLMPPTDTWQDWVDFTLEIDDHHWLSQMSFISINGSPIATTYHKLEDIDKIWPQYEPVLGKLPHFNRAPTEDIYHDYYRQDDILNMLHEDFIKWHTL